ncbi:MAG: hypothetical protein ACI82Z_000399 [Cellvibrionaceae bacterium]|jgi:hypothetical protein
MSKEPLLKDKLGQWWLHWSRKLTTEKSQSVSVDRQAVPMANKRLPEYVGGVKPPEHWLNLVREQAPHLLQPDTAISPWSQSEIESLERSGGRPPAQRQRLLPNKFGQWLSYWGRKLSVKKNKSVEVKKKSVMTTKPTAEQLPESLGSGELGPPEHWLAMVQEQAPQLLEPNNSSWSQSQPIAQPETGHFEQNQWDGGLISNTQQRLQLPFKLGRWPLFRGLNLTAKPDKSVHFKKQVVTLTRPTNELIPEYFGPDKVGPPEHWLAMVRKQAPHWLKPNDFFNGGEAQVGDDFSKRSPVRPGASEKAESLSFPRDNRGDDKRKRKFSDDSSKARKAFNLKSFIRPRLSENTELTSSLYDRYGMESKFSEPSVHQDMASASSFSNGEAPSPASWAASSDFLASKFLNAHNGMDSAFQTQPKILPTHTRIPTRTQTQTFDTHSPSETEGIQTVFWPPLRGEEKTEVVKDSLWPELKSDFNHEDESDRLRTTATNSIEAAITINTSIRRKQRELVGALWNG